MPQDRTLPSLQPLMGVSTPPRSLATKLERLPRRSVPRRVFHDRVKLVQSTTALVPRGSLPITSVLSSDFRPPVLSHPGGSGEAPADLTSPRPASPTLACECFPDEVAIGRPTTKGDTNAASPADVSDRFEKLSIRCCQRGRSRQNQRLSFLFFHTTDCVTTTKASGMIRPDSLQRRRLPELPAVLHQDTFYAIHVEDPDQSNRDLVSLQGHEISRHHLGVKTTGRTENRHTPS